MRRALLLPVLLAGLTLTACDGEAGIQLVRGRVEVRIPDTALAGIGATARTEGRLVAASRTDLRGVFLLALPEGGPYRIELALPGEGPVPISRARDRTPLLVEVCDPGALVDTGTVTLELDCLVSTECVRARDALASCRALRESSCTPEELAVASSCGPGPGPGPCTRTAASAHTHAPLPTAIGCQAGGAS